MPKYANFFIRALAGILDFFILLIPSTLFWIYIADSKTLQEFLLRLVIYLTMLFIPAFLLLYNSIFTFYLGGNLGKILSGISVEKETGGKLTFKRLLFRYSIGYMFSSLVFGLGYLNILTDEKKRAWHDKAVGSVVIIKRPLWPLAILLTLVFIGLNGYFSLQAFNTFNSGPIKQEALGLGLKIYSSMNASSLSKEASSSGTLITPANNSLGYTETEAAAFKNQMEFYDQILTALNQNGGNFDPEKVNKLKNITTQLRDIAKNTYQKMEAKKPLSQQDLEDLNTYVELNMEFQTLSKEILGQ